MHNTPITPKVILNILFYFFYVWLVSVIFSFVFPQALLLLGKTIPNPANPVFYKTQILIIVLVLVLSIIARKYLYISIHNDDAKTYIWLGLSEEETKYEPIKEQELTKKKPRKIEKKHTGWQKMAVEWMKIYINKEIK